MEYICYSTSGILVTKWPHHQSIDNTECSVACMRDAIALAAWLAIEVVPAGKITNYTVSVCNAIINALF